jgi:hypothetical protein
MQKIVIDTNVIVCRRRYLPADVRPLANGELRTFNSFYLGPLLRQLIICYSFFEVFAAPLADGGNGSPGGRSPAAA